MQSDHNTFAMRAKSFVSFPQWKSVSGAVGMVCTASMTDTEIMSRKQYQTRLNEMNSLK